MGPEIITRLEHSSKDRRLWRRRACKFIRGNYHVMSDGPFKNRIRHKSNGGWLGDFLDETLISIIKSIMNGGGEND